MSLKTRTLITGARKGIGRFLAEHLIKQGHLVIGCSRKKPDWDAQDYHHHEVDVSDEKQVLTLFGDIKQRYGGLDNLINNAGIAAMNPCLLTPMDSVRDILETNVVGTFLFCREAARLMLSNRGGGRIVNYSSVAIAWKLEGESIYAASKAAVISLTQILAREFAPYGITVNCIGPNPVMTDLIKNLPKDKIDKLIARQAIPRLGTFEDVANVVDFFLRKESSLITGQNIYLGGV